MADDTQPKTSEDKAQARRDLFIYPLNQLGTGTLNAFFPTILPVLLNTVYFFTAGVAGAVEAVGQAAGWLAAPASGAVIDRVKFKKARFWPWFLIGGLGVVLSWILVYSIPTLSANPAAFMIPVAILLMLAPTFNQLVSATGNMMYARVSQDGKQRSLQAMWGKVAREAIRTIVGFVFPLLVIFFAARGMLEHTSWAMVAIILGGFSITMQIIVAFLTKRSKPEQDAMEGKGVTQKGRSLLKTISTIFTNRALVSIWLANSLLKVFFFYHIIGGFLLWRYYFGNWAMMAVYMTTLAICSTAGALLTPLTYKLVKDAKRGAILSLIGQIAIYAVAMFVMRPENMMPTLILLSGAMIFNGLSDAFMQPLFAHAADYSTLKTGNKDYGINMSAFALSIQTGILVSTITRTAFLVNGGYDGATINTVATNILGDPGIPLAPPRAMEYLRNAGYTASEAAAQVVPDGVMSAIRNINTIVPLIICVVIILILLFVYPLNDKKVKEIQEQIAERDAAEAAAKETA